MLLGSPIRMPPPTDGEEGLLRTVNWLATARAGFLLVVRFGGCGPMGVVLMSKRELNRIDVKTPGGANKTSRLVGIAADSLSE
jgi:hypothetical protein